MAVVAGVDFGTLSVRVTVVDTGKGRLGSGTAQYPLPRKKDHCDMASAVLCGITDPAAAPRSVCAMGHKWMWNASLGGLPPEEFLISVDPLLKGVRAKLDGRYAASDKIAGELAPHWAAKLGLRAGIPIPVGAFDAHWDAIGAGARIGDVVNVVG